MNIFAKKKMSPENGTLFGDSDRHKDEKTLAFLRSEAERRRLLRMSYELQWQLNTNFLYGNQHCDINAHRMKVENYEPVYDYLSREVFNRIAPLMETRLANLQTVRYNMTVQPRTNEYEDALKAEVCTALLRAKQEQSDFSEKLDAALHWSELTGSAFFLSGWNDRGGDGFVLPGDEVEGNPIQTVYEGDVEYCVLSSYEVLPDNLNCETVSDQHSILIEQVKNTVDIENLYGRVVSPEEVATFCYRSVNGAGGYGYEASTRSLDGVYEKQGVVLYTYMEKPNVRNPRGRLIIAAGDTLICDTDFPYRQYPLCQMKCQRVPGQFYGKSVIENLIPLQRSYNGIKNKINDYINLAASGQLLIEQGSIDVEDLEGNGVAPGIPVIYERGSEKPTLLPMPTLPSLVCEQCDRIAADMEYVSGVSQLLVSGKTPDGITSGTAIDALRNIDNTRLSMTADNIREAVRSLAVVWLWLYHDFAGENRAIMARGRNDEAGILFWNADQIDSFEVSFTTENELKDSDQARYERLLTALDRGLFGDRSGSAPRRVLRKARQAMGIDSFGVTTEEDLQEQNAQAENMYFVQNKEIAVGPLDDHGIHLEEHRLYALQKDFRDLVRKCPEKAEKMYRHIAEHTDAMRSDQREGEIKCE